MLYRAVKSIIYQIYYNAFVISVHNLLVTVNERPLLWKRYNPNKPLIEADMAEMVTTAGYKVGNDSDDEDQIDLKRKDDDSDTNILSVNVQHSTQDEIKEVREKGEQVSTFYMMLGSFLCLLSSHL